MLRHLGLCGAPKRGWTSIKLLRYNVLSGDTRNRDPPSLLKFVNNDKRNDSVDNLSFFNFPSKLSQRSQWITVIKRDEGLLFGVS